MIGPIGTNPWKLVIVSRSWSKFTFSRRNFGLFYSVSKILPRGFRRRPEIGAPWCFRLCMVRRLWAGLVNLRDLFYQIAAYKFTGWAHPAKKWGPALLGNCPMYMGIFLVAQQPGHRPDWKTGENLARARSCVYHYEARKNQLIGKVNRKKII